MSPICATCNEPAAPRHVPRVAAICDCTLPMASTIGLQWSDAFIGKFPHFGVGVTAGFASIPTEDIGNLFAAFGFDGNPIEDLKASAQLPENASKLLDSLGFPFPAVTAEARLGGFILPFDIGLKAGFIPDSLYGVLDNATGGLVSPNNLDYLLVGFDVRYALVDGHKKFLIPDIIIGGGYNFYRGKIAIPMPGMDFEIQDIPIPKASAISDFSYDPSDSNSYYNYSVSFSEPSVGFGWESHVIDVKAQVSKKILLIMTPYVGVGASYGRSRADAGMYIEPQVTRDGSSSTISQMQDDLAAAEEAVDDISGKEASELLGDDLDFSDIEIPETGDGGFLVSSWENGWGFRAYGGLSINLWFVKIDASVMYDILGSNLGAQLGLRFQF
jgi:hypothetical protein